MIILQVLQDFKKEYNSTNLYFIRSIFQDTEQQKTVKLDTKLHALTANITARMVMNRRFSKPAVNSSLGTANEETSKVWGCCSVTFLRWTPSMYLIGVWLGQDQKTNTVNTVTCLKEIGLLFQILLPTTHSIVNSIGRTYVLGFKLRNKKTYTFDSHN